MWSHVKSDSFQIYEAKVLSAVITFILGNKDRHPNMFMYDID